MNNTLKLIEKHIPDYDEDNYYEDGYEMGHVVIEVTIQGIGQYFKIPAYETSSYGTVYQFDKAIAVTKETKEVNVWKTI